MSLADIQTPNAVLSAMCEFDRLGRDSFLERYAFGPSRRFFVLHAGRLYDSKALAGASHGYAMPGSGALHRGEFSGGEPVLRLFDRLGFEVIDMKTVGPAARAFRQGIREVLERYVEVRTTEAPGKSSSLWGALKELEQSLVQLVEPWPHVQAQFSSGKGRWASVPWMNVMDGRVTDTTTEGLYVCYLFREDMSGLYATLNLGVQAIKDRHGSKWRSALRAERERLQAHFLTRLGNRFADHEGVDLRANTWRGSSYEEAVVVQRFYAANSLPNSEELMGDLYALMGAYESYVANGGKGNDEQVVTMASDDDGELLDTDLVPGLTVEDVLAMQSCEAFARMKPLTSESPVKRWTVRSSQREAAIKTLKERWVDALAGRALPFFWVEGARGSGRTQMMRLLFEETSEPELSTLLMSHHVTVPLMARPNESVQSLVAREIAGRLGYTTTRVDVWRAELALEQAGDMEAFEEVCEYDVHHRPWAELRTDPLADEKFSQVMHALFPRRYREPLSWWESRAGTTHEVSVLEAVAEIAQMMESRAHGKSLLLFADGLDHLISGHATQVLALRELVISLPDGVVLVGSGGNLDALASEVGVDLRGILPAGHRVHLAPHCLDLVGPALLSKTETGAEALKRQFHLDERPLGNEASFVARYPLPAGLEDLLIEILEALSSERDEPTPPLLQVLAQALSGKFREAPVGTWMTLDRFYDTLVVRDAGLEIAEELGDAFALRVARVAALLARVRSRHPVTSLTLASALRERDAHKDLFPAVVRATATLFDVGALHWSDESGWSTARRDMASSTSPRPWLFVASPERYDLAGKLPELCTLPDPELYWRVTRYRERMTPGDIVILWQAEGGERHAGVYALAEIVAEPVDAILDGKTSTVVSLRLFRVPTTPLLRSTASEDPVLAQLEVLRASPDEINYPITPEALARIQLALADAGERLAPSSAPPDLRRFLAGDGGVPHAPSTLRRLHLALTTRRAVALLGPPAAGAAILARGYGRAVGARRLVVPLSPSVADDLLQHDEVTALLDRARGAKDHPFHLVLDGVERFHARALAPLLSHIEESIADPTHRHWPANLALILLAAEPLAEGIAARLPTLRLEVNPKRLRAWIGEEPWAEALLSAAEHEGAAVGYDLVEHLRAWIAAAAELGVPWEEAFAEAMEVSG